MLQQNMIFANEINVYTFYETNKPQVIKISSKLIDRQIEDLLKNDINIFDTFLAVRTYIRNIDVYKPKTILEAHNSKTDIHFDNINTYIDKLMEQSKNAGCLIKWD